MAPRISRVLMALAALFVLLSSADDAAARKFQMSGMWVARNSSTFLPLQFATGLRDHTTVIPAVVNVWASMGNLTGVVTSGLLAVSNGPIPGQGGVTATGSAPATLRILPHRFVEDAMTVVPLAGAGASIAQIATSVGVDAPYAPVTLAPGGGPGSFTWCPGDPACAAGGGMRSTDPPRGAGARHGRVIYRAGANRFGGAMQLGLRRGGYTAAFFAAVPFRVAYIPFWGAGATLRDDAVGALGSADLPALRKVFLPRAFATQPTMALMKFQTILYPGPKVTTMQGLSTTGTGPILYQPTIATGPMGTLAGQYTTHYGFGQTTGTAIAQQTQGTGRSQTFFTVMGSDARTPLGAGNLSLVAGGLSFRINLAAETPYASFQKVTLTLGAPIPSLSPAGVAAAAALMLLAAGWALRSRIG